MKKRVVIPVAAAVVVIAAIAVVAVVVSRHNVQRHRVFRMAPAEKRAEPPVTVPPVDHWSERFERLSADDLEELLDRIEKQHPDLYAKYSLAYLDARVLIERNELKEAAQKLAPYLAATSKLRDLALYHEAEIADAGNDRAAASRARQQLIAEYPKTAYRDQAIDEEADYLQSLKDPAPLIAFAQKISPTATTERRREMSARIVEAQIHDGRAGDAFATAMALLSSGTTDDASDRVSRAIDRPDLIGRMTPQQKATLGDSFRNHRHFDRAVALLSAALTGLPARRDDLLFQIGRSYFGNEQYAEAEQTYMRGANAAAGLKAKAQFLFHASRAAQLRGDDARAEQLMTATIALPGKYAQTMTALTQRIRRRVKQKRFAEAASDMQLVRKIAPNDPGVVDAALAYACGMLAGGNAVAAISALNSVPPKSLSKYDQPEYAYWRARAQESRDPHAAFTGYLTVLRATVPTHFAYFARERLESPAMQARVTQELAMRDAQVRNLIASKQFAAAKQIETDRILLSSRDRPVELQRLASIYQQIPA